MFMNVFKVSDSDEIPSAKYVICLISNLSFASTYFGGYFLCRKLTDLVPVLGIFSQIRFFCVGTSI